ncbi:hypothetical protein [Clostridium beijerinckii]|uniref:hypothetical protein n=1 Tax=Clostridium beijerinckii TaxID=1520 RepID=UPI00098CA589|nr:hypothetical protein [Clostridium beijerinckii]NRT76350.1 hypothetical protein [Clostridium beijerinckii]OOM48613.1 hypothetical protein CBEIJ_20850 [Clostridium beijerinckii]
MSNFLWNLNIEVISCGWESVYQSALKECPNGKIEEIILSDSSGIHTEKCIYDPIKCRKLIIETFNSLKSKAIELYVNRFNEDFKECCNKLIHIDITLYNLLREWTYTNDVFSNDDFQPENIIKIIDNNQTDSYFENCDSKFDSLKFINL